MDELRRNGSGYYDPTAFKALKKIEREEREMEVVKGEIWEVEIGKGELRMAVVLATHKAFSTILALNDEPREERTLQINAQGMKCANPAMVSFKFHDSFNRFIRKTTDIEFADIISHVVYALGLDMNAPIPLEISESKEINRLQMEIEDLKAKNIEIEKYNTHLAAMVNEQEKTDRNTTILRTERDLYKSQYESLLERVIAKAV